MDELKNNMIEGRGKNYKEIVFLKLFERFDEDSNGFIQKHEMVNFIKSAFSN